MLRRAIASHPGATITAAMALGVIVGICIARPTPSEDIATVTRTPTPVVSPSSLAPSAPVVISPAASTPPAPASTSSLGAPPRSTAAQPRPPTSDELDARGLSAERALLDAARIALARGEGAEALDAAERHAKEFPRGRLSEEREALAIRALAMIQRTDEARSREERFRARFPNSLMLPGLEAVLGKTR
jgi:hypothetical protein